MSGRLLKVLMVAWALVILSTAASFATDLTLFVTSDTHFVGTGVPSGVKTCIQAMNGSAGIAYPLAIGGKVSAPYAVITCGDLCDGGAGLAARDYPSFWTNRNYRDQWAGYDYYFPKNGVAGNSSRLKYPNLATAGNHDFYTNFGTALSGRSWYVANQLKARYGLNCNSENGNVYYSMNVDGVHIVSLGRWGDPYVLSWLAGDLASVGASTPVVLFLHYAFDDGQLWYTDAERAMLADVIRGYRVVAILHGHTHSSGHYLWNGYDVYDDGSAAEDREFGVLRLADGSLTYAQYRAKTDSRGNWNGGAWQWWHGKAY